MHRRQVLGATGNAAAAAAAAAAGCSCSCITPRKRALYRAHLFPRISAVASVTGAAALPLAILPHQHRRSSIAGFVSRSRSPGTTTTPPPPPPPPTPSPVPSSSPTSRYSTIAAISATIAAVLVYNFRHTIESFLSTSSATPLPPLPPLPPPKKSIEPPSVNVLLNGAYESGSKHEISGGAGDSSHAGMSPLLAPNSPTSALISTVPTLSSSTISTILTSHANSVLVNRGMITSIDYCQYAANEGIEDSFAIETHLAATPGTLIGVFDGHSGAAASVWLRRYFLNYLQHYLLHGWTTNLLQEKVFTSADAQFINQAWEDKRVTDGLSGACVNVVHVKGNQVTCANAGDCVAVIGRRISSSPADAGELLALRHTPGHSPSPSHVAIPLSFEHQIDTDPKERARLLYAHPNESDVIRRARVKGRLQPSRGFGDAAYKSNDFYQAKKNLSPNSANSATWTAPYTTASPDIITHTLDPARDEFLVISSDGLYQDLNMQQVVEFVGEWKENRDMMERTASSSAAAAAAATTTSSSSSSLSSYFSSFLSLPSWLSLSRWFGPQTTSSSVAPLSAVSPGTGGAATYLVERALVAASQNSIGHRSRPNENLSWILQLPRGARREHHDDCTVLVVWLGQERDDDKGQPAPLLHTEAAEQYDVSLPPSLARAMEQQRKGLRSYL